MGTPWRRLVCAAAVACAFPIHAAVLPAASSAYVGPIQITVVDTDLGDGVEAGYTLLGVEGTYVERTVTETGESTYSWSFDPAGGASSAFVESDGLGIRSFASTTEGGPLYVDALITDSWSLTLAPNTLATVQMDAAAEPAVGGAFAWAALVIDGQAFGDGISSWTDTFTFQYGSGASELTGLITRNAASTAVMQVDGVITHAPEPSTALLVLLGLGGLALRGRGVVGQFPSNAPPQTRTNT